MTEEEHRISGDERFSLEPLSGGAKGLGDGVGKQTTTAAVGLPRFDDSLIGHQIDNYVIQKVLGQGGLGTVYQAHDRSLDRRVALKFLHLALEDDHQEFFRREARALAALSKYPGILQIYAWGEYAGRNYLVLEYVEKSARDLLKASPEGLSLLVALRIAEECADALAYSHAQSIIHRDVKPSNILIEAENQRAKLADFGIARFYDSAHMTSTQTGSVSGSPPYMSPEQARGEHLDARSDIFSLGATLYELLCGETPYEGENARAIINKAGNGEIVPIQRRKPGLPKPVLAILAKAMAFAPNDRYAKAELLAQDLRQAIQSLGDEAAGACAGARADADTYAGAVPFKRRLASRRLKVGIAASLAAIAIMVSFVAFMGWRNGAPTNTALAEAKERLEKGSTSAEAETLYRRYLEDHPSDAEALYGLGYSLLRQDKNTEAESAFGRIDRRADLRTEGEAAVAMDRKGEQARPQIEAAKGVVPTAYPDVLLGRLDCAVGKFEEAAGKLKDIADKRLNFDWQRTEAVKALGQALYHMGDYANALKAFEQSAQSPSPSTATMANAYIEMARAKNDEARRAAVSERVTHIKALMAEAPPVPADTAQDTWTSRPLIYCLLPVRVNRGVNRGCLASESGLADVLPSMLGKALDACAPMQMVDRETILDVLSEQDLSAQLSSEASRLRLGQVLGARLLVECTFDTLFEQELVNVRIVDTETTQGCSPEGLAFSRLVQPDAWVRDLASRIWTTIETKYPLRGKLAKGSRTAEINIGSAVGVTPGLRFNVAPRPEPRQAIPNVQAVVEEVTAANAARVKLEGMSVEAIPADGLFAFVEPVSPS